MSFCHLHTHDEYSALDGLGIVEDNVEIASERGFKAMAQTNHGNIDGAVKFKNACDKYNIKPIFGSELYFVKDMEVKLKAEKRNHLTVLAKNEEGWKNLNKILNKAHLEGFYYRPRADRKLLLKHLNGLIVLSGCLNGLLSDERDTEFLFQLYERIGEDLYLEIMPIAAKEQVKVNKKALEIHNKFGIPLVATNDIHYPDKDDAKLHEVLLAIQTRAKWDDDDRWTFPVDGLYMKTYDEMFKSFKAMPGNPFTEKQIKIALEESGKVADKCIFDLPEKEVTLPDAPIMLETPTKAPSEILMEKCVNAYKSKIKNDPDDMYFKRMKRELKTLVDLGFEKYFLVVEDLVRFAKGKDIFVGPGRGSVGGCLVAYLLGITNVDPIKYGLIFERFINPDRVDLPDIDLDFDMSRRDEVIQYIKNTYGEDCVAQISTFSHLGGRSAVRDVARVFDVPGDEVDKAAKVIPDNPTESIREGHTVEDSFNIFEEGKAFKKKYPKVAEYAARLEGQIRHQGVHAAGVVIADKSFDTGELGHIARRGKGAESIIWDMRDAKHFGLVKIDVLGLKNLAILQMTKDLVREKHDKEIDFENMEPDDAKTFDEFNEGNTACVFQFGSHGLQSFTNEMGVNKFSDLYEINALWRPGPLRSGLADEFRKRKRKKEASYLHPIFKDFTNETYGLIIYQEQVMQAVRDLAGMSWSESDRLRQVISKSKGVEQFKSFEEKFVDGCRNNNTLSQRESHRVFELLKHHGSYSFNKAHAVGYSLLGYFDMWCKVHYPAEYMAAWLSMDEDRDAMSDTIREARRLGLKIDLPSLNHSNANNWTVVYGDETRLVCPLKEIKGIGDKTAAEISRAKKESGPFETRDKFEDSVKKRTVNKKIRRVLLEAGALDELDDVEEKDRTDTAKELLPWDVVSPSLKYESLLSRLSESMVIKTIGELKGSDCGDLVFTHGSIVDLELKFSKGAKEKRIASADDVRAVATLDDGHEFIRVIFSEGAFDVHRGVIEGLDDRYVIVGGRKRPGRDSFVIDQLWILDDLLVGDFGKEGGIPLMSHVRGSGSLNLIGCSECDLRNGCRAPVPFSEGKLPVMIVGEAPGKEEDERGEGFVGDAGRLLFEVIGGQERRKLFHITNAVHCRPPSNRTPTKKEVNFCSRRWLNREIEETKPWIIFALGNTAKGVLTGGFSKITRVNARAEWNDEHQAWIVFSVHPASVFRHGGNKGRLQEACSRMFRLIEDITPKE